MPICEYFFYFWFKYETSFIFEPFIFDDALLLFFTK